MKMLIKLLISNHSFTNSFIYNGKYTQKKADLPVGGSACKVLRKFYKLIICQQL
jgi:hypothetical protein